MATPSTNVGLVVSSGGGMRARNNDDIFFPVVLFPDGFPDLSVAENVNKYRYVIGVVPGDTGVADQVCVCCKGADDTYYWIILA